MARRLKWIWGWGWGWDAGTMDLEKTGAQQQPQWVGEKRGRGVCEMRGRGSAHGTGMSVHGLMECALVGTQGEKERGCGVGVIHNPYTYSAGLSWHEKSAVRKARDHEATARRRGGLESLSLFSPSPSLPRSPSPSRSLRLVHAYVMRRCFVA